MEKITDWFKIPNFLLINFFFITPIRLYGFATMLNNSNWETRKNGYKSKENNNLQKYIPLLILIFTVAVLVVIFQLLF